MIIIIYSLIVFFFSVFQHSFFSLLLNYSNNFHFHLKIIASQNLLLCSKHEFKKKNRSDSFHGNRCNVNSNPLLWFVRHFNSLIHIALIRLCFVFFFFCISSKKVLVLRVLRSAGRVAYSYQNHTCTHVRSTIIMDSFNKWFEWTVHGHHRIGWLLRDLNQAFDIRPNVVSFVRCHRATNSFDCVDPRWVMLIF